MTNRTLIAMLERHEGRRLKPYRDTRGKITIGVGRNLSAKGISDAECNYMRDSDITDATRDARKVAGELLWSSLNPPRQAVLVSMAFNLGAAGLAEFHDLFAALNRLDYLGASGAMLDSAWAKQVGHRAKDLADMMANGTWCAQDELD